MPRRHLGNGDAATVEALFDRLSPSSRAGRFHAARRRLTPSELESLARVDADHLVLVAYVDATRCPRRWPGWCATQCKRPPGRRDRVEVADLYQGCGIGTQLVHLVLADARADGIEQVDAVVQSSNRAALRLLRRASTRRW